MKMKKSLIITVFSILLVFVLSAATFACTNVVVGKDASTDGSVITSHTVDGQYDARVKVIHGKEYEEGAMMELKKNICHAGIPGYEVSVVGEIPQAEETYTYFHAGYPFMNEHSVIIGETTFFGRGEYSNENAMIMIEQLEILGLQRAKTAREAIQVMGSLAEKYGYADIGETLTVTDPNEAWVFEIIGPGPLWTPGSDQPGAVWAAQRVPDGHVTVAANRSRIEELDLEDSDNYMASSNVKSFAEEMGYWDPDEGPFVFWKAYCPDPYGAPYYQARREWRALSMLAPSQDFEPNLPKDEHYPFSIEPDEKVSVRDVMTILRDYLEGTQFDLTEGMAAGPFGTPNRYATPGSVKPEDRKDADWERAISMFRCSYSFVSQARDWLPEPIGGVAWFGEDAPHTTCYIPIYCGVTDLPESYETGARDKFDESAWWAFNFVSNWADLKYDYMIEDIRKEQDKFEKEFLAMQPTIDKAAEELYNKDPELARQFLTDYTNSNLVKVEDRWWELAEELVYKYHDGYVNTEDDVKSVGYPTWWLEEVNFGDTNR
ncbi:MAG TPA: C69 family dipeptidase [Halanaerobiales bacterium]|nr:C69 family dipeptidase [Halanaerobiales bacterium]